MRKLVVPVAIALGALLLTPAVASASPLTLKSLAKTVAALQTQVKTLNAKVTKDEALLSAVEPYVKVTKATVDGLKGPTIVLSGVNLQIRSATAENDTSGLGNLIVGWDDVPTTTTQRGGSNNLVCGDENNFISKGCFVAGFLNTVSGLCASVSGGEANQATDSGSSVCGGQENQAAYSCASVSGGVSNQAGGDDASVSGGNAVTEDFPYGWAGGTYESH